MSPAGARHAFVVLNLVAAIACTSKRGDLVAAAQKAVDELQAFVVAKHLVALPPSERVIVAPAPPFDLGLASMHSSPPLETTPVSGRWHRRPGFSRRRPTCRPRPPCRKPSAAPTTRPTGATSLARCRC